MSERRGMGGMMRWHNYTGISTDRNNKIDKKNQDSVESLIKAISNLRRNERQKTEATSYWHCASHMCHMNKGNVPSLACALMLPHCFDSIVFTFFHWIFVVMPFSILLGLCCVCVCLCTLRSLILCN